MTYVSPAYGLSLQMEAFSTAAKLTHVKYGTNSMPEVFDILKKLKIVKAIAIQRTAMSTSPARGDRRPKKSADHKTLHISWTLYRPIARLTLLSARSLRHTRKRAIPMST